MSFLNQCVAWLPSQAYQKMLYERESWCTEGYCQRHLLDMEVAPHVHEELATMISVIHIRLLQHKNWIEGYHDHTFLDY